MHNLDKISGFLILIIFINLFVGLRCDVLLSYEYKNHAELLGWVTGILSIITFLGYTLHNKFSNRIKFKKITFMQTFVLIPMLIAINIVDGLLVTIPYTVSRVIGHEIELDFIAKKRLDLNSTKNRRKHNIDILNSPKDYSAFSFRVSEDRFNKLPEQLSVKAKGYKTDFAIAVSGLTF